MKGLIGRVAQAGLTLVEVIVVAIIVAALAAVAVPMYANYASSSRENAAANAAGSVASFMGACLNRNGVVAVAGSLDGVSAGSLTCRVAGGPTTGIQLPAGIAFVISKMDSAAPEPGMVTATHNDGGEAKSYNY